MLVPNLPTALVKYRKPASWEQGAWEGQLASKARDLSIKPKAMLVFPGVP